MRHSYMYCPRERRTVYVELGNVGNTGNKRPFSKDAFIQKYCKAPARSKRARIRRHIREKRVRTLQFMRGVEK